MSKDFVSEIEMPPGFQRLTFFDLELGVRGMLPHGAFLADDGQEFEFFVTKEDNVVFSPPISNDWNRHWIEGAIHFLLECKRARRAHYRVEAKASEARRKAASKRSAR